MGAAKAYLAERTKNLMLQYSKRWNFDYKGLVTLSTGIIHFLSDDETRWNVELLAARTAPEPPLARLVVHQFLEPTLE